MAAHMPDQEPQPQGGSSELASFGEELRREREIRGISLKEIADATKISKRFLEAIERNDHRTLPAPVFTRGFVREYARYLGLSADDMVSRYNQAAAGDDRIEQSTHLDRLVEPHRSAKVQPIPPAYKRIDRNVWTLFLIVILLIAASYWAIRHKRESRDAESRAALADTATSPAPRPHLAAAAPAPPPAAAPSGDVLRLTLELTDDSWVTLEADGRTVVNEELRKGERKTFEAKDKFRFRTIGNAAGVEIAINDVRMPPLGREGEVVHDRIYDRRSLEQASASRSNS